MAEKKEPEPLKDWEQLALLRKELDKVGNQLAAARKQVRELAPRHRNLKIQLAKLENGEQEPEPLENDEESE